MRLRISPRSVSKALSTVRASTTTTGSSFGVAVRELASFLRDGGSNITVLTGAGCSTDSAIPDYRGQFGSYTLNPDYKPIFYQAFVASDDSRRRYWARSFLGYLPVKTTDPNPTHYALAALQTPSLFETPVLSASMANDPQHNNHGAQLAQSGFINTLTTQNVDGLHQKAGTRNVTELHGTLHKIKCMSCGHIHDRSGFQQVLADLNPEWDQFLKNESASSLYSRMNADGDVELRVQPGHQRQHLHYSHFNYPTCFNCKSGHYKPSVVFFGENIPNRTKEESVQAILESNGLLVIGSSLATFSAFRLVQLAKDAGLPIALINMGPTRGDALADLRYDMGSSQLLTAVALELGLNNIPGVIKQRERVLNAVGS
ncbi:NAD-dependent protein lipoamidase sirtuin-4 [Mortierella sp. GBA30]|nr:NAD-dependent protein lipoamidase sirtuin-4 [Mortierella sp. GBA30]